MKYQRLIEKLKSSQKISLYIGVPIFIIMLIAALKFTFGAGKIWLPGFLIVLVVAILGIVFISSNTGFEKKFEKIRQIVGAGNPAELANMLEQAEDFEDLYFITDQFFLNFFTFSAYPRSEIQGMQRYEERDSESNFVRGYCIRLEYGEKRYSDRIHCDSMDVRDRIYKLLLDKQSVL